MVDWVLVAVSSVGTHAGPFAVTLTFTVLFRVWGSLTEGGAVMVVVEVSSVEPHRKFGVARNTTVMDAPEGNFGTAPVHGLPKVGVVESSRKVGHVAPPVAEQDWMVFAMLLITDPDQKKYSLMMAPSAGAGPLFVYVTVHVIGDPGDVVVAEGDADTARSALVSIAVLTLLAFELGSLSMAPGAGSTRDVAVTLEGDVVEKFPVIFSVTSPRCGSVGTVPVIALPLTFSGEGQTAPSAAEQVAATLVAPAGRRIDSAVPSAAVSALLPTVTV
nr:hypothetical protein [Microbacterium sp. B19]